MLPASNWFSLRFGRKCFLLACVVQFILSCVCCGAAPSLTFLLVARLLQGLLCLWTGLRNIGGSIGISAAQTEIVRHATFHQVRIVATVPQTGYWLQQDVGRLHEYLGGYLGSATGEPTAFSDGQL